MVQKNIKQKHINKSTIVNFLCTCFLTLSLFLIILSYSKLIYFYEVRSGSMRPALPVGSLIVVKKVDPQNIYKGNIILFRTVDGNEVSHRVNKKIIQNGEIRFITKGDRNSVVDAEPVSKSKLLGKVIFEIPFLGFIIYFVKQPFGILLVVFILFALLVIYDLMKLINNEKRDKT